MVNEKALRKAFLKIKRQISQLKAQDRQISEEIQKIQGMIPSQKHIEKNFRKIIKEEISSLISLDQIDSLIAKNPDVVFMLQHFHDLDDISITKKQFKHFSRKVDMLRREAAELKNIKNQMKRNLALETSLRKLGREVKRLGIKNR
jgi:Tfp pilus assembly protein PilO